MTCPNWQRGLRSKLHNDPESKSIGGWGRCYLNPPPKEEMLSVVLARHRWETPSEELSSVAGQKPAKLVAHNLTISHFLKRDGSGSRRKITSEVISILNSGKLRTNANPGCWVRPKVIWSFGDSRWNWCKWIYAHDFWSQLKSDFISVMLNDTSTTIRQVIL